MALRICSIGSSCAPPTRLRGVIAEICSGGCSGLLESRLVNWPHRGAHLRAQCRCRAEEPNGQLALVPRDHNVSQPFQGERHHQLGA